jgi:uncharacterized metal-binding protein YceD (DUF177 family)
MTDCCVLLLEHLREGKSTSIHETFDPLTLELNDSELSFDHPILVKGSGYLAEDLVVLQLDITGSCYLPCAVCNKPVKIPLVLKNTYITKPVSECSSGKVYFMQDLREAILLEVPSFRECNEGHCPERPHLTQYLKQNTLKTPRQEDSDLYYPFDGLEEQLKKKQ